MITCNELRLKLREMKSLKKEFDLEMGKIRETRDTENSIFLKEKISDAIENLYKHFWRLEIIKQERKALSIFFREYIDVPKIPKEITRERLENWEKQGFELHYLPKERITKNRILPGCKERFSDWFYEQINNERFPLDSDQLPGRWILVDKRTKPNFNNGNQVYEDDNLAQIIRQLREKGLIEDYKIKESRFNINKHELEKAEVKNSLASILGVEPAQLSLPRAIEWNYLANAYYPEWGNTDTYELFGDNIPGSCISGGDSAPGLSGKIGLSRVCGRSKESRRDSMGFRLMVCFDKE